MGALYRLDFPGGKSYVGITTRTAFERFQEHCRDAAKGRRNAVFSALRKYGSGSVAVRTLVDGIGDWELLCLAEVEAIDKFRTRAPFGYNMTAGGDGVINPSDDVRARKSASAVLALRDPETFRRVFEPHATAMRAEDVRRKIGEKSRAMWACPVFKAEHSARVKAICDTPAVKAKHRAATITASQAQEARAANSAGKLRNWQDPETRERILRAQAEGRAKMSAEAKARMSPKGRKQSPEAVAKRVAAIRATYADRKQGTPE